MMSAPRLVLRVHLPDFMQHLDLSTFSFVAETKIEQANLPFETIPAVLLGRDGTVSGFVQVPRTASPGCRLVQSSVRGRRQAEAVAPPPELFTRSVPKVPLSSLARSKLSTEPSTPTGPWDEEHNLDLVDEPHSIPIISPPFVQEPVKTMNYTHGREPTPSNAHSHNTLAEWQSAFGSYTPHKYPFKQPIMNSRDSRLPSPECIAPAAPRRRPSRLGLWKDALRPPIRRHRGEPFHTALNADVFERITPDLGMPVSMQGPEQVKPGRDVPDVPQDEWDDRLSEPIAFIQKRRVRILAQESLNNEGNSS